MYDDINLHVPAITLCADKENISIPGLDGALYAPLMSSASHMPV